MAFHTVSYEGIEIEYELLRKDVKYINLRVNKQGKVVVSAGKRVPLSVIEEFVQSKAFWIITHLAEIEKLRSQMPDVGLFDGKTLYYLGKPYRLLLERGLAEIRLEKGEIHMSSPKVNSEELRQEYLSWLKRQAAEKFEEIMNRIFPLVEEYNIVRPKISIRNMRSIWGSCTTGGDRIRLNLQLMKADEECIEQVILHELLHFPYPNHGEAFYAAMTRLMPDWKERKQRLETKYKDGI
ncbi:MAG: M48 family metallopeptidase [Anaerotignum sp.]|nr:M48 family metallopeptidase [Anaerotignum sp.]